MNQTANSTHRPGFTLVELLVVLSIVSVLIALLLPSLHAARRQALRVNCAGNMKQVSLALINYSLQFRGRVPTLNPLTTAGVGTSLPTNRPFQWDTATVYNQLINFGATARVIRCPAMTVVPSPVTISGGNDMFSTLLLLAGLGDPIVRAINENTSGPYGVQAAKWYDAKPSASTLDIAADPTKLLLADLNMVLLNDNGIAAMTGGPAYVGPNINWLYSNHADHTTTNLAMSQIPGMLRGSNRLYADGHGQWVGPELMGRDESSVTSVVTNARYSYFADQRPMYW